MPKPDYLSHTRKDTIDKNDTWYLLALKPRPPSCNHASKGGARKSGPRFEGNIFPCDREHCQFNVIGLETISGVGQGKMAWHGYPILVSYYLVHNTYILVLGKNRLFTPFSRVPPSPPMLIESLTGGGGVGKREKDTEKIEDSGSSSSSSSSSRPSAET